jgi:hypothetical protein
MMLSSIRGCTYPGLWRCSIISGCHCRISRTVVCFECILIVLMLLLSAGMMISGLSLHGGRALGNHTPLLVLVVVTCPDSDLLLLLLPTHLASGIAIVRSGGPHIHSLMSGHPSEVLLGLIHHSLVGMVVGVDLVVHRGSYLHGAVQRRVSRE